MKIICCFILCLDLGIGSCMIGGLYTYTYQPDISIYEDSLIGW